MPTLRSCIFLDRLQPQTMCYIGSTMRGFLPRQSDAAMIVEVAPGMDIEWLTDIALKHDAIRPGTLVVERQFGYLEFHAADPAAVRSAGAAILAAAGAAAADALAPEILASRIVDRIDPYHSFLVNRNRQGSMLLPGDSLFILEMTPAANALLAANQAEKAADVKLVDCRFMGAAGRLYMAGTASDVRTAAEAATAALGAGGA